MKNLNEDEMIIAISREISNTVDTYCPASRFFEVMLRVARNTRNNYQRRYAENHFLQTESDNGRLLVKIAEWEKFASKLANKLGIYVYC